MARTSNVFARVEPDIKEQAEQILSELGIPMSNAVGMFLRQVVIQRGLPFEVKLPNRPLCLEDMSDEELYAEVKKGFDDIKAGNSYTSQEIKERFKKRYGFDI